MSSNLFKVIYCGISFTALFTGYIAAQNLASGVYKNLGFEGLGEICVMTIYTFLAIGSIFAARIKRGLSHKAGIVFGACGYTSFAVAGLLTAYCKSDKNTFYCTAPIIYSLNIGFSAFVGFAGSILWLTQSVYLNGCCTEATKGSYNGIFWSLMQMSQILSSSLATFVLPNLTEVYHFYIVLLCFGVLAICMLLFLPALEQTEEDKNIETLQPLSKDIGKFFNAMKRRDSTFLLPGMTLIGIAIAFYANFLGKVNRVAVTNEYGVITEANKEAFESFLDQKWGVVLMALAFGEVAAGLVVGKLSDKFEKNSVLHAMILVPEVGLILTVIAYFTGNYYLTVLAGFVWGFTDTALNTIVGAVIGSVFLGSMQYFSLMRFFTGMGAMYGSLLAVVFEDAILTYSAITACTMLVCHLIFFTNKNVTVEVKEVEEPLTAASETA